MVLPEGLTGEIINGRIRARPRPAWDHDPAGSRLGADIEGPYGRGRGGPGGWWIIDEFEVHFILDMEVIVVELAGWLKKHMPSPPEGRKVQVVWGWVCEIFLPSTKSTDREEQIPLYAQYGIQYTWFVDPKTPTLKAYELIDSKWRIFRDDGIVSIAPFDAILIRLADPRG